MINVVTNPNGRGLERDAEVVSELAARAGHEARVLHWEKPVSPAAAPAALNVYLETMPAWAFPLAPRHWLFPNPEWWDPRWNCNLPRVEHVLCKTREAVRLFSPLAGERAEFVGFRARDRRDDAVPRERRFLCVAGVSVAKGADAVVEAWRRYAIPHQLTVVGRLAEKWDAPPNAELLGHVPDEQLRDLQNRCRFHLQPSWTEGFGMTIHEGLSCGAVVVVPDAPPMNEWRGCAPLLTAAPVRQQRLATLYRASPEEVASAARRCADATAEAVAAMSAAARLWFETESAAFEARFLHLLSALA